MSTFFYPQKHLRILILVSFISFFYFPALAQIPSGYYDAANGKTGSQLKAALNDIISGHTTYPYSSSSTDVWDILQAADKDPNNSANVIGIYSGFSMNAAGEFNNGDGWNREHVWAKSRGDFGTSEGPGTDCHHLRVADISTNGARGNKSFDYGDTFYNDTQGSYSGSTLSKTSSTEDVWEPRNEVKGDVARMMFYMATRYEGENGEVDLELTETLLGGTNKSPFHAKLSVLLVWHQQDPVSSAEIQRNDIIYSYQNNRNPFIDHPEYVCEIYSCSNSGGNNAPYFTSNPTTSVVEGSNYSYTISTTDPDGDNVSISNTLLPNWMNFTDNGDGSASISGTTQTSGDYSVSLSVSDGTASSTQNFTVTVSSSGGGSGSASELFFSEYIEGSSYNKGLEIANFTGSSVDLSSYSIMKQTNGSGAWKGELNLSGSIPNGDVFVVVNSSASSLMQSEADLSSGTSALSFNGNDPLGLFKNGQLIDVLGAYNSSNSFATNTTLIRQEGVTSPNPDYTTSEWNSYPTDTFSFLGSHTISGAGGEDTEAPSIPANIQISNVRQNSFDINWDVSTDNVGIDQYVIYLDGSYHINSSSTTATVDGLSASSNYVISISAKDVAGNESSKSSNIGVTTAAAVETSLNLSLTFDNYPEESTWEIVDGSTVIAEGGPYGNYADGSTLNIPITIQEGCYDFNIYDAYGDGICCSYGNGSYTLSENGVVIVSGGSFGSGESTSFCVGSSNRSLTHTNSISSKPEPEGFNVYPNPVISELEIFTGKMEATSYEIISLSGKMEQSGSLNAKTNIIKVNSLKSALYILKVYDTDNVVVKKIMVK